jgi:hypothetical protein
MKNFFPIVVIVLVTQFVYAQSFYDKYDGMERVSAVIVNKKMFSMMANVKIDTSDPETQQYLKLIKQLDNLAVFTTSDAKISADMKLVSEKHRINAGLKQIGEGVYVENNIKLWVKSGTIQNQIIELLMLSEQRNNENQTVLMSVVGAFDSNDITILMTKMKIPQAGVVAKIIKGD